MSPIENSVMDTGPEWTDQDAQKSIAQGWSIFSIVGREPETEAQLVNGKPYGHRPYELQAVLDEGIFADDGEAWDFVRCRVAEGDTLATKAVAWLKAHSPCEYAAIFG